MIDPATKDLLVTVGVYGAAIAAIFSGGFHLLSGWRDRVATDNRHLREQAIRLAIEQWQHEAKAESVHMGGGIGGVKAFEYHGPPARDLHEIVFRALRFADAFSKDKVTEANLKDFLSKPKPE